MDRISVIIAVYNAEQYLEQCIESILCQSFKNIEIILVDDGSKDTSALICDRYARKHENIIAIHQENKGVSAARNKGMQYISGNIVSFIDADDYLDDDMYELLVQNMHQYDADIAHCGYKHIVGEETRLIHDTGEIVCQSSGEALSCLVGGRLFSGSLWNKIYKYELIQNLNFREDIKINEDILFNFFAFANSNKSVFVDLAKYNYVAHMNSSACFVTQKQKKIRDACEVSRIMYDELKNTPMHDIAANRYLNQLLGMYRLYSQSPTEKYSVKECKKEIWKIYNTTKSVGRKMEISVLLIHYFPIIYKPVYAVYDHIRKPNWEV